MEDPRSGTSLGAEAKGAVLAMQGVMIATGEERSHTEPEVRARRSQMTAPHDRGGRSSRDEDLLDDDGAVLEPESPGRPRLGREAMQAARPVGVHDTGIVEVRADGKIPGARRDGGVEAVDQHKAPGGRCRRGQEQRVIATRAHAGDGSRRVAAAPVRLEPLAASRGIDPRAPLLARGLTLEKVHVVLRKILTAPHARGAEESRHFVLAITA